MHKIKKLFILPLILMLVLSVITLWPSAQESIPPGPIDSTDKNHGVTQIMQAGVQDKSFAEAIYDSFAAANYFGDETKDVRQILSEYTGKIDASNKGITNIYGIEWLRSALEIDFSNSRSDTKLKNTFDDLEPLTTEYIMNKMNISLDDCKRWFKYNGDETGRYNLKLNLVGVPIRTYGLLVGSIDLNLRDGDMLPLIESKQLVAIKECCLGDWSVSKNVELPKLSNEGNRVHFYGDELITYIDWDSTSINKDAYIQYDELENDILKINSIKHSGYFRSILGIQSSDGIRYFKLLGGTELVDVATFAYDNNFMARIYMPVVPEKKLTSEIKITKYATSESSGRVVVGAKYRLYYDDGDQNYNNDIPVSEKDYITDENGEFYIEEGLDFKKYYLKEVEAPEGFLINENPILLDLTGADISITGGDKNLGVNVGDIKEDPNTVYIDRYSKDVDVQITAHDKFKLTSVDIKYCDRETQNEETLEGIPSFDSTEEASKWITDWINNNKGDETAPGIIDGKVTIHVEFEYQDELKTTDDRPTTDVEFNKAKHDIDEDGNLNIAPLPGAVFKLECMHEHTDACLDETGGYTNCTDPHADLGSFITDTGCSWSSEATSDSEGKVKFSKLNSGKYRMREIQTPDGYLPTDTVWILEVDAANHTYTITVDSEDGNSETTGDFETGYTIINETYNIKVKKVDAQTNEPLKGAKFGLYKLDEDGNWSKEPIQVDITRDNGLAIFEKLDEGQYKIKELQAPLGYELITEEIEFKLPFEYISSNEDGVETEISSDAKTITFTVSNKNGINLPRTGADITGRIAAIGIVIMGISAILLKRQVRKKS